MAFSMTWANPAQKGIVLDGCAGPGGWSEGIRRWLGLTDVGLEWDEAACRTRAAAGHATVRVDVSSFVLGPLVGRVWGLLFSPPCTKFSAAGKGFGRLVLDPLADGIRRTMRGEDCRQELRERIYPVALAEQEKANADRAPERRWTAARVEAAAREDAFVTVLMLEPARYFHALAVGEVPAGGVGLEWLALEQVPAVLPLWEVYAAELRRVGWSVWCGVLNAADYGVPQTRRRAVLVASGVRSVVPPEPTHAEHAEGPSLFGPGRARWVSMAEALGWGATDRPVPTVTAGGGRTGGAEPFPTRAREILEASRERGAWALRNNTQAGAAVRTLDQPAGTLFFGGRCNDVSWVNTRPATTVCATDRLSPPGHRDRSPKGESQFASPDTVRITQAEAAVLQSFPAGYPWQGTKTRQFEQIGNAVPPLLAAYAVSAVTGIPVGSAGCAEAA